MGYSRDVKCLPWMTVMGGTEKAGHFCLVKNVETQRSWTSESVDPEFFYSESEL